MVRPRHKRRVGAGRATRRTMGCDGAVPRLRVVVSQVK